MKKRITSLALALLMLLALPQAAMASSRYVTGADSLRGGDYTSVPEIAEKLDRIFSGELDMYTDIRCSSPASAPVGSRNVPLGTTYYVKSLTGNVYSGTSCYIYANAVYATLFGDVPYHGDNAGWKNSYRVAGNLSGASYEEFSHLGVGFGALLRTTANKDGTYNGNYGHSLIVLDYDAEGITYLEGNGDGKGLIRVTERNWDTFNSTSVGGRGYKISFIVQPRAERLTSFSGGPDHVGRIGYVRSYGGHFTDVGGSDWYGGAVAAAYETGFMDGRGPDTFDPDGLLTVAEAVTLCAWFLSLYYDDRWDYASQGGAWYAGYYDYLAIWGIDTSFAQPDESVTRGDFAVLMAHALPEEARGGSIPTVFPDVPSEYDGAVRALTRCGVITGSDNGLYLPYEPLTRAEAAAFLSRMADRSLRAG